MIRTRDILIDIRNRELQAEANFTELDEHLKLLHLRNFNQIRTVKLKTK